MHPRIYKEIEPLKVPARGNYRPNRFYDGIGISLKIALSVLERGLSIDRSGRLVYDPKKFSWFSRMVEDMRSVVSRRTIDENLDSLMDEGFLASVPTEMIRVRENGRLKWVHPYSVANEFRRDLIRLYRITHDKV
jgi:hypothetical protein